MPTVKESGGNYGTLYLAIEDAATSISIEGKFNDLPHENGVITWDTAGVTVTCDSSAQWFPDSPRTGGSYHHALHCSAGGHCITISAGTANLQGIEIKQTSSTTSAEGIRVAADITVNLDDLLIWTANATSQQDGVYSYHSYEPIINLTNCQIVDCYRAGVQYQKYASSSGNAAEINVNSCTIYNNGGGSEGYHGGVTFSNGNQSGTSTCDIYVYDSVVCNNNNYDFEWFSAGNNGTYTVDRTVYQTDSTGGNATITDSEPTVSFSDTSQGAGYVNVEEKDTAPYDLRLDGTSGCEALEMHSDGTGPNSMVIPSDDIMGTPRSAPYCAGFFEYGEAEGNLEINVSDSITCATGLD